MFILAFIVGIIISQYNNIFTYDMDLAWQVLFGGLTSIMLEYLFGITFNLGVIGITLAMCADWSMRAIIFIMLCLDIYSDRMENKLMGCYMP